MKLNTLCLSVGIILSIISKLLQLNDYFKIGNFIVLIAALFFVLAILTSIKFYKTLLKTYPIKAIILALTSTLTITSFQLMMMLLVGKKHIGAFFFIPFIIFGTITIIQFKRYYSH